MTRRVTIAGGDVNAWMAAAYLAHRLEALDVAICVAGEDAPPDESEGMGSPALPGFNAALGIDMASFVRETGAVPYLGMRYDGWGVRPWFRPCGGFGADLDGIAFHHHWLRLLDLGGSDDLGRFSPEALAAREGLFGGAPGRPLSFGFAFDAAKYRALLQNVALAAGVRRAAVADDADLVIDCGGAAGEGDVEDWSPWLAGHGAAQAEASSPLFASVRPAAGAALRPGCRRDMWRGRTVALGRAACMAEPLVVPLDLTIQALERLTALWPRQAIVPAAVERFNAGMAAMHRDVRDFTIAHYVLSGRQTDMPDSLADRLEVFRACGDIDAPHIGPVRQADWLALFTGFGLRPRFVHPAAERMPEDELKRRLARVRTQIQDAVNALPEFAG